MNDFGLNLDYLTFGDHIQLRNGNESTKPERPGLYRRADD